MDLESIFSYFRPLGKLYAEILTLRGLHPLNSDIERSINSQIADLEHKRAVELFRYYLVSEFVKGYEFSEAFTVEEEAGLVVSFVDAIISELGLHLPSSGDSEPEESPND